MKNTNLSKTIKESGIFDLNPAEKREDYLEQFRPVSDVLSERLSDAMYDFLDFVDYVEDTIKEDYTSDECYAAVEELGNTILSASELLGKDFEMYLVGEIIEKPVILTMLKLHYELFGSFKEFFNREEIEGDEFE